MSREEKTSSTTAKTALGLAIGGLSLAAVQGGNNGIGGILGNLFGGGQTEYQQMMADKGTAAITELGMLEKWIMPVMGNVAELQTQAAVNSAVDLKNQEITALLFQMAENNTNSKFALFNSVINGSINTIDANMRSSNEINALATTAAINSATCNVIRGVPYISPQQMADPYQAGSNILMSRHVYPPAYFADQVPFSNTGTQTAIPINNAGCNSNGYVW